MSQLEVRNHDQADETRPFVDKGRVELVQMSGGVIGRATFEPGWRWSEHVKPIAGTDSCQASHMGYCVSGRMVVRMDDGTEVEIGPGDVLSIPPGHDGWVVGDEPCVQIDFTGMGDYAKEA
jgi:quercetin dioxygenase-like cupin family protein